MGINGYSAQYENDKLIPRDIDIIRHFALYIGALETRSKMLLDAFVSCREDEMEYMQTAQNALKENEKLKREIEELKSKIEELRHRDKAVENVNVDLISDNTELYGTILQVYERVKEIVEND